MLANGIKQTTTTTGTGNLTLTAVTGYPTLANAFAVNQPFSYVLLDANGLFKEAGIGYLSDATTLVRARVSATFSGSAYVKDAATAASLTGTTTVICTPHAASMEAMLPTVDGQSGINRMVSPANRNLNVTPFPLVGLRLYYVPFLLRTGGVVTSLNANVTTAGAAGAVVRMGVYTCKADGYIGDLLATTADAATDSTGLKVGPLTAPAALPPGWYFAAIVGNVASTVTGFQSSTANIIGGSPLGFAAGSITAIEYRYETLVSAALPATASLTTTAINVGVAHVPAIFMGVS